MAGSFDLSAARNKSVCPRWSRRLAFAPAQARQKQQPGRSRRPRATIPHRRLFQPASGFSRSAMSIDPPPNVESPSQGAIRRNRQLLWRGTHDRSPPEEMGRASSPLPLDAASRRSWRSVAAYHFSSSSRERPLRDRMRWRLLNQISKEPEPLSSAFPLDVDIPLFARDSTPRPGRAKRPCWTHDDLPRARATFATLPQGMVRVPVHSVCLPLCLWVAQMKGLDLHNERIQRGRDDSRGHEAPE